MNSRKETRDEIEEIIRQSAELQIRLARVYSDLYNRENERTTARLSSWPSYAMLRNTEEAGTRLKLLNAAAVAYLTYHLKNL